MTDNNSADDSTVSRRPILKSAAATGAAAVGLTAFGGTAAAQQNLQVDADNLVSANNLLSITINNVNVLNNVDVDIGDIIVTIQDNEVDVISLEDNVIVVDVEDVLQNFLNENNVNVAVNILSDSGQLAGTDTVQVVDLT